MNPQTTVVIRPPKIRTELEDYFDLRYRVLRMPFGYEPDSARDEYDDLVCWNLAAFLDDSVVGVARLHRSDTGVFTIRWVAVDPNQRHRRIGSLLIMALEEEAYRQGANTVELVARNNALGFYAKLGYDEHLPAKPVVDITGKAVMEQTNMSKSL